MIDLTEPRDTEFWEPWTPKVGQRVRVRLSGECRHRFLTVTTERGGAIVADEPLTDQPGHDEAEDGRTGCVVHVVGKGLLARLKVREGHGYVVDYDVPIQDSTGPVQGKTYAACELEPEP